jgi:hypothetical protein
MRYQLILDIRAAKSTIHLSQVDEDTKLYLCNILCTVNVVKTETSENKIYLKIHEKISHSSYLTKYSNTVILNIASTLLDSFGQPQTEDNLLGCPLFHAFP